MKQYLKYRKIAEINNDNFLKKLPSFLSKVV